MRDCSSSNLSELNYLVLMLDSTWGLELGLEWWLKSGLESGLELELELELELALEMQTMLKNLENNISKSQIAMFGFHQDSYP